MPNNEYDHEMSRHAGTAPRPGVGFIEVSRAGNTVSYYEQSPNPDEIARALQKDVSFEQKVAITVGDPDAVMALREVLNTPIGQSEVAGDSGILQRLDKKIIRSSGYEPTPLSIGVYSISPRESTFLYHKVNITKGAGNHLITLNDSKGPRTEYLVTVQGKKTARPLPR